MHPVVCRIGSITIHWYGLFMAAAFFVGLLTWTLLGKREKRSFDYCADLLFWIMVSGILGARLAFVVSNARYFLQHPIEVFYLHKGGLIYYGGFLGAGLGLVFFAIHTHEKWFSLLDFVIVPVPLGHVLGRMGCFMNGCCFGKRFNGILSVQYPHSSLAHHAHVIALEKEILAKHGLLDTGPAMAQMREHVVSIDPAYAALFNGKSYPVYPVQFYEAGINLLIFILLVWAYRRKKVDGTVLVLYLLTYPVARFCLEFIRGDDRMHFFSLSVAQWVSIGLFATGLAFLARILSKAKLAAGDTAEQNTK